MRAPELFDVPVAGGTLRVARWPGRDGAPVALCAHGVTATHRAWSLIAEHLDGDVTVVAPDLRGRGGSNAITGPFGIPQHTEDLAAVLDHLSLPNAVFVGHSMGAFVVAVAAVRHPERVGGLVIMDGGIKLLDAPVEADIDALLHQIIGPSMERLKTTFASRAAYQDFWRRHPAFAGDFNEHVQAYVNYDLIGDEPALRSGVSLEAVYADSRDTLTDPLTVTAIEQITRPAIFLRAQRGVMNEPSGLYSHEQIAALQARVPHLEPHLLEASHFSMMLGQGSAEVAAFIRKACGA
ncbi:MAG TPA: alpha/beta hydrolase [Actinomycetota bacterium]|nr:alpha/beta hydrolase [Actinomycetota bacterium]